MPNFHLNRLFSSLFIHFFGVIKHKYVWQVFLPNCHLNLHSCIYVYIFTFHQLLSHANVFYSISLKDSSIADISELVYMSRKKTPQKLTQLSSRFHPRHLVGKRTAQKDITIDTTSDSQVNSNFPNRWSPASLIFPRIVDRFWNLCLDF